MFSSVQSLSCVQLFATPWTAAHQTSLSITNSRSLLILMSIESGMPSNHLILCHSLLLLPSIFPSMRVFSNESVLHIKWPNSNEFSGLISFRLDLFAVQRTLKSLLQHHSSKASVLWCSALWSSNSTPGYISRQNYNSKGYVHSWISRIAALFLIARKWKQAKCPSTDEWI